MRSRMSGEVSEWSRGKYLYMGSHILGSEKRCSFFGIVPGSFQKVLEDSGGVQKSPSGFTTTQGLAWAAGRHPGLIGIGAPSPQKPMWLGKAKKEGVLVGSGSPSPLPLICALGLGGAVSHAPPPIYRGEGGSPSGHTKPLAPLSLSRYSVVPLS